MDREASGTEFDSFADHFFSQPSLAPVEIEAHEWHEGAPPLSPSSRRAMQATVVMLVVSATVLGGFLLYSKVLMPTPVELDAAGVVAPTAPPNAVAATAPHAAPAAIAAVVSVEVAAAKAEALPPQELGVIGEPVARDNTPVQARSTSPASRAASAAETQQSQIKQAFRSLNSGNPADALKRARQVLSKSPNRADAWLVLGSAYGALHDTANARAAFHNCVERAQGSFVAECRKLARE